MKKKLFLKSNRLQKKKIKDVTFKELVSWANDKACNREWGLLDALCAAAIISEIYQIKPLFFKNKKREQKWQEIKGDFFNLEAEITIN